MKRKLSAVLLFFALFLLTPWVLLTAFDAAVLDEGAHLVLYERYDSAEAAGLTGEQLGEVNWEIVSYLKGRREDLLIEARIDGETVNVFNERELSHMEDVRSLFDVSRRVRLICLIGAVCLLVAMLLSSLSGREKLFRLGATAVGAWALALLILALFARSDFTRAFNYFHEILFSNDLWLLDPRTDRMIRMMPEPFFVDLALRAASFMGISLILYLTVLFGIQRIGKGRRR